LLADDPPSALGRAQSHPARDLSAVEPGPRPDISKERSRRRASWRPVGRGPARIRLARSSPRRRAREGEGKPSAPGLPRGPRPSDRRHRVLQAARVHEGAGDARGSAAILDEASAIADELGIRESDFEIVRAWNYFQVGDWETTVAILAEHERTSPELDQRFHTLSSLVNAWHGRHDLAVAHLEHEAYLDPGTSSLVRAEVDLGRSTGRPPSTPGWTAAATIPYQFET
jgi:hypothetical protein